MGEAQACASTQQQSDFKENLNGKIAVKNIKGALRNRSSNKTAVLLRSNYVFIVG